MGAPLPGVATFWRGPELGWLSRLSLTSFLRKGHPVTLFHAGPPPRQVPDGVAVLPAQDIYDPDADWTAACTPTIQSDMFRMWLQAKTDLIWIDADVICLRPLSVSPEGYLVGREAGPCANGAVLRLPRTSPALTAFLTQMSDPGFLPDWTPASSRRAVLAAPAGTRLATACSLVHGLAGPQGQSHYLQASGEWAHVLPTEVLNPLPWDLADLPFNPFGGVEGWLTGATLTLHLYNFCIRRPHRTRKPDPRSWIARHAADIGFDI